MDAERVDSTQTLGFNQVALDAGHDSPDVAKRDAGEAESPQQCNWYTKNSRQYAVAPVFGDGEGGIAGFPHSIHTVCAIRLSNHILKLYLQNKFNTC